MHEGSSRHSSRISCSCARDSGVACRGHLAAQPKSPAVVHDRRVIASPVFRPRAVMTLRGWDIAPQPEPYSGLSRNVLPDEPSAAAAGRFPARAGSTSGPSSSSPKCRDHPRSRGEHGVSWLALACARGSPPLARGALINFLNHVIRQRITPARAGSTAPLLRRCLGDADHPRSRGEHGAGLYSCPHGLGSPPLARGAPQSTTAAVVGDGITPARAGSTVQGSNATVPHRDHPRSRGEHHECVPSFVLIVGSPPLARGAPRMPLFMPEALGITPARAGSTTSSPRTTRATADHPRSRGEHGACCCGCCVVSGSPPLARGARNRSPQQSQPVRITPARAGSTRNGCAARIRHRDHPRSRGEHTS